MTLSIFESWEKVSRREYLVGCRSHLCEINSGGVDELIGNKRTQQGIFAWVLQWRSAKNKFETARLNLAVCMMKDICGTGK